MFPTSCDTLVALAQRTGGGATLFAKNSDRPPAECQPLFCAPRQSHPPGAVVRCQYLAVPQTRETLAVLGSRPWWLWGFEHGVNECRVAIGNEALHARELPGETGFLGMDLVRLGLERGRTAAEAKRVITDLLEHFGQGGSASADTDRRYHAIPRGARPSSRRPGVPGRQRFSTSSVETRRAPARGSPRAYRTCSRAPKTFTSA